MCDLERDSEGLEFFRLLQLLFSFNYFLFILCDNFERFDATTTVAKMALTDVAMIEPRARIFCFAF